MFEDEAMNPVPERINCSLQRRRDRRHEPNQNQTHQLERRSSAKQVRFRGYGESAAVRNRSLPRLRRSLGAAVFIVGEKTKRPRTVRFLWQAPAGVYNKIELSVLGHRKFCAFLEVASRPAELSQSGPSLTPLTL